MYHWITLKPSLAKSFNSVAASVVSKATFLSSLISWRAAYKKVLSNKLSRRQGILTPSFWFIAPYRRRDSKLKRWVCNAYSWYPVSTPMGAVNRFYNVMIWITRDKDVIVRSYLPYQWSCGFWVKLITNNLNISMWVKWQYKYRELTLRQRSSDRAIIAFTKAIHIVCTFWSRLKRREITSEFW